MDSSGLLKEAQLLFIDGKDKESIEAFTKAINAGADPYIAFVSRGAAHLKLKQGDDAIKDFGMAIEANSKSARAYFFRGLAHMLNNEFENSVEDFTKALELKTDYGMAKFASVVSLTVLYIFFFSHSRANGNPVAMVLDSCFRRNDSFSKF